MMSRVLTKSELFGLESGTKVTLISAGKMAVPMTEVFLEKWNGDIQGGLVAAPVGELQDRRLPFLRVGHPVPTQESVDAGQRALELARKVDPSGVLILLLSGGASASLSVPAEGVTLETKIQATKALLRGGVSIHDINCVRKHLSRIKGGWLAASARGRTLTFAVSDVVGPIEDDPAVIGSGPTTGDPTSFDDALRIVDRAEVRDHFPFSAREVLQRGRAGDLVETPKPGDPRLTGSAVEIVGSRRDAVRAAAVKASNLGLDTIVIDRPVIGEAREIAPLHLKHVVEVASKLRRPACVMSTGETTVTVKGSGRGGRNQEFGLALVDPLSVLNEDVVVASVATDGVDGPTEAAGVIVSGTTLARSRELELGTPRSYLDRNDSLTFFQALGDLVITGPTDTNVGDLQVFILMGSSC